MPNSVKQQDTKHATTGGRTGQARSTSGSQEGGSNGPRAAAPVLDQHGEETQQFEKIVRLPNGLEERVCRESIQALNHLLADTATLRDLYKKHHWQVSGPTFYQLHLLFDKHFEAQSELIDALAERVQMLGGISIAMAADVAETTCLPRPPRGREEAPVQIARLLQAHETILKQAHQAARKANDAGDDGTADLIISQLIRTNEMQVWFLAEHLVNAPLVRAERSNGFGGRSES